MSSLLTYNLKGESVEKTILPKGFLGKAVSPALLAQAVRIFLSNQRQAGAKTKTRGDVAKTTAKMYKQKGTGRARHGSYAAPIFVGGGVSHGPTGEQNWKRSLSKTMTKMALFGALTKKMNENRLAVITGADKSKGKTTEAVSALKRISGEVLEKTLLITTSEQKEMKRAWRNLEKVTHLDANQLNPYFVLPAKRVLITTEAIEEIVKTYAN
jgi:large subunit ribosomal protein L4